MGWGPEPIWSPARIAGNAIASESGAYAYVTVEVPIETAAEYAIPGQYVQLRRDPGMEKSLFLAIASPPPDGDNPTFEFLVKRTEGSAWFTDLPDGACMEMSQVLGSGFPIAENLNGYKYDFPTQNIVLCAGGSGLAPIKAAMESGQLQLQSGEGGVSRTCRLYYGERCAADLALVDRFAAWEESGVEVVPVLSQPDDGDDWQGRTGYVQNALEEDGVAVPRNSAALLCGPKGMTEAVTQILTDSGIFEGRILTNY